MKTPEELPLAKIAKNRQEGVASLQSEEWRVWSCQEFSL